MKNAMLLGGLILVVGCGAAPPGPAHAPAPTPAVDPGPPAPPPYSGPRAADVWALPEGPRDAAEAPAAPVAVSTAAWARAVKAKGIGSMPTRCAAFARPAAAKPRLADLGAALEETDAAKRDALLAAIEGPNEGLAPVLRAARADLAPTECADAIVDPMLTRSAGAAPMAVGLSLAAKLARTATSAPAMKDASNKEKVKRFIQGPLRAWMVEQASAIEALSAPASELTGLARGVVAVEAGMADLRLVDRIRSAPTPGSWDKDLKAIYEAALDEALEPRKARGRDAALVGLADLAAAGIMYDARVERARALLSKLYGGRRIDALDGLLLPGEVARPSAAQETTLAILRSDPAQHDALARLGAPAAPPASTARARLEMGRTYWRRVDFVEAAHAAAKDARPEGRLLLALALALAKGPVSAREMMSAPSPSALGLAGTEALDALAAEPSSVAGLAAFDAAHLRSLAAPDGAPAGPWFTDVATRFEKAAALLEDSAQKRRAMERAAAAEATAKAIVGQAAR
jgi:hypothetical protein